MNLLLTGTTGKVGSRLARRLMLRGHRIRALVRDPERACAVLPPGSAIVQGDLLDPGSLAEAARGVDAVVHCAAFFRGASAEQAHAVNEIGTMQLAQASRAAGVRRFLFTSTGLVYGATGGRLVAEDDPCEPAAPYPATKLAAERALLALDGLDVRILRLPFVYGDGDPHIAEAVPLLRHFPAKQRMSLGHHADVAQAVALVLEKPSPEHRVYNVVDDEAPELATIFRSVGEPPPDGSEAERARSFDALLDGSRMRREFGFAPIHPRLADALAAGAA